MAAVGLLCAGLTGIATVGFGSVATVLPWVLAVVGGLVLAWPGAPRRLTWATRLLGTLMDAVFS